MTDYRLDGLSTRTFEHLVQSLALDAIVSTVTPFGDGPDGGREATFTGLTHYGPNGAAWNGYGVIQAKFLQRPKTPQQDGDWILRELSKELRKYSSGLKTRDLDYYILATNVTLSAVADSGTKDKVIAVLEGFVLANGLKGFDIWDYDKIRILIDNNESVRRCYAAWITPGDVLMQLSDWLSCHRKDYHRLVVNYLQKELLSDQFARLEQAGHTADEAIPLAQVFVDLPIADTAYVAENLHRAVGKQSANFVEFIAVESENVLAPRMGEDEIDLSHRPVPGRFVLIGGPGQGKTTLGQYVCQIFRSSLLKDVPRTALEPEARQVMQAFDVRDGDRLPAPVARRLPLRVVLSDFATALAGQQTVSLLAYLTGMFCKRTNSNLTAGEFQALIAEYPIILVLDGLDEVPASSNRDQVLAAVQDFSVDIASSQMDALIIATSRPQGYNEDFSPAVYRHLWLTHLPTEKALEYGTKLAKVRFAGNADRIDKIVGRLRLASRAPATARIMRSPLQVTILTLLVDRRGQLPQEKWALFDEYYALIYQRETERDIPAAAILRERKDDIDAVHRLAGLLLQVESEASGSTDAKLTTEQFGRLVETYLRSEGHEGEALDKLRKTIIEGAATRLVFLVGLESGQVGFEIRSLQEFMAAEGLLDAPDERVQHRLRSVARSANWRNVTVFAAGKIFAERRYLRDTVEAICVELNDDQTDRALMLTYAGSELALDLLEDGPVARHATKSRSLTRVALRLLQLPGEDFARRLAGVYQDSAADVFREELTRAFEHNDPATRKNAWLCLDTLIEGGARGLDQLVQNALEWHAPDVATTAAILSTAPIPVRGWRMNLAERVLPGMDPGELRRASLPLSESRDIARLNPRTVSWIDAAVDAFAWRRARGGRPISIFADAERRRVIGEATVYLLSEHPKALSARIADIPTPAHPLWKVLQATEEFERAPSKEGLAAVIRAVAACSSTPIRYFLHRTATWPVEECQLAVFGGADGESLATAAESGLLGDCADWFAWENEWAKRGLRVSELKNDVVRIAEGGDCGPWFPIRGGEIDLSIARVRNRRLQAELLDLNYEEINRSIAIALVNGRYRLGSGARYATVDARLVATVMDLVKSGSWSIVGALISNGFWEPPVDKEWAEAMAQGIRRVRAVGFETRRDSGLSRWLWRAFQKFPYLVDLVCGMGCITSFAEHVPTAFAAIVGLDLTGNAAAGLGRGIIGLKSGVGLDAVWADVVRAFEEEEGDLHILFPALKADVYSPVIQVENLLRVHELAEGSPAREQLAVTHLRTALRGRRSELVDHGKWLELGFDAAVRDVIGQNAV